MSIRHPPSAARDNSVAVPVTGQWYRNPLSHKSHLLQPQTDHALCGMLLLIDEVWWQDSTWESRLGMPAYLVMDIRAESNRCGPCKEYWKVWQAAHPTPYGKDTIKQAQKIGAAKLQKHQAMVKWFTLQWGEKVTLQMD